MQWVILVGGKGTRLGHLTAETPKPLLPVGGRPFLEYLLDRAVARGAGEVVLLAGHHAERVVSAYDGRSWLGVPIRVSIERQPLGTGGAFRQAAPLLDNCWVAMNGDTLFDIAPRCLALPDDGTLAVMALRDVRDTGRSGVVTLDGGRVTGFRERGTGGPGLVNGGVYVMRRAVIDLIPGQGAVSLEAETFPLLARLGRLRGTVVNGFFIDIGVPEDYARAQHEVPALAPPRP